ncbi:disease resistance protein RGA2-like [Amaranthus tricolor]|uniref:disease resistance protein RGA2-like n=1 Tax=Amaranthus tricolor TaxID=29722 RepID=UPI00258CD55D|nr:disease resistance protein RGA2-like [Amaranthus tricolor]
MIRKRMVTHDPRETHSFCTESDIISREDDKKKVIDMLLSSTSVEKNVSVISIVGIGGLGKTSLAQLVYNDAMIQTEFPLRMWVCVSDDFNVGTLLQQIIADAKNQHLRNDRQKLNMTMDQLQSNLREVLNGEKYLLVLDDIWNEDYCKWVDLSVLLEIVTTRSNGVANIVGSRKIHELGGLSEDDSWKLFERIAFEGENNQNEDDLVKIGKEIICKCKNVPLAIRVVGSLLRGQDTRTWEYIKNTDLVNIKQDDNGILPVLKISYYHLPFHLKSCFKYCAVFPKVMKDDLIHIWMALGFVMPLDGESLEDAGTEILSSKNSTSHLIEKTRHSFIDRNTIVGSDDIIVPSMIGQLMHLRYLDLLENIFLTMLPESITKLYNLQTLKLRDCSRLKTLPRDLSKLVNLRDLDIFDCKSLRYMPPGMNKMTSLHKLTRKFVRYDAFEAKICGNLLSKHLRKIEIIWRDDNDDSEENTNAKLFGLRNLKYVDKCNISENGAPTTSGNTEKLVFFPSLEEIWLHDLPKLKGWVEDNIRIRFREGGSSI